MLVVLSTAAIQYYLTDAHMPLGWFNNMANALLFLGNFEPFTHIQSRFGSIHTQWRHKNNGCYSGRYVCPLFEECQDECAMQS
jgi:hypothetical protein